MSTWTQQVNYQYQTGAQSLQLSMSTWTQTGKLSIPNHWAQSCQPSMSTWTQASKLSKPNMGTFSSAINVNTDTS